MTSNELLELVGFLNSDLLWLYFIIVIAVFYGLISLLTWSPKKPLMFLGIPTIIVGVLLVILRFSIGIFLPNDSLLTIISSVLKPLLTIGIICIIAGIAMIIIYKLLNKHAEKKETIVEPEVQEQI